jgi:uncharacterized membrane protein
VEQKRERTIGNRIAPARFVVFVLLLAAAVPAARLLLDSWLAGFMAGFDLAAGLFLLSCATLFAGRDAATMRDDALGNDANRRVLLLVTSIVMAAVLATVAAELVGGGAVDTATKALVVATLFVAWLFGNMVFTLHYAHLYYQRAAGAAGALEFPPPGHEPDYADFAYFAFTLGMTFQTSDVAIRDRAIRRVVTFHCLAAFVFNIGVLAFTINVLGR